MEVNRLKQPTAQVGFKGHQNKISDEGFQVKQFNFPYDSKNWDCSVEFFRVKRNDYDYSYAIDKKNGFKPFYTKPLTPNGLEIDLKNDLKLKDSEPVAYRYKLSNKKDANWVKYAKDDDASICGDGCNLLTTKGTNVLAQGPMYLVQPDAYNPGYVYAGFKEKNTGEVIKDPNAKDLSNFSRTFANKAGGTYAGIQQKIPELRKNGYKRYIGTPGTGGDNRSSHMYWIKRMNQTSPTLGNINNFDSFNIELFKNGMGYVSDSAYTSQGLEGVDFQYAIRWMNQADKPHEYYQFRMQGLEDAALGMGVVPKNMDNLRHKIVNSPDEYKQLPNGQIKIIENGNKDYDPKQPTFIQPYDDLMVSEEQRQDRKNIIDNYANTNAMVEDENGNLVQNNLAINNHDDTLVCNAFQINPAEYRANVKNLNALNKNRNNNDKINLNSPMGTLIVCKFSGLEIRPKDEGGFVTWDSNSDMAKLSYTESDYDTQLLESIKNPKQRAEEEKKIARAHAGNRDMLVDTMRYWTRHVRNVQNEYTARTLGKLGNSPDEVQDRINSLIYNRDNQQLPDDVALNKNAVENLVYGDYNLRDKDVDYNKALDKAIMSYPLDALELADDTVGALASPYLSKRSPDLAHVGESRYDAMFDKSFVVPEKYAKTYNKMNNVLTGQIHEFATKVLRDVDKHSDEKIFQNDGSKLTEYGQYVVPLVAGDITKYALIKSLVPSAETKILKDGAIAYDYDNLIKNASLRSIGINGDSPEDEANQIVNQIKRGTEELTSGDVSFVARSIKTRIKETNAMSFRFAEAMVDKSGLGMGHRIDAAKDVADMDAIRSQDDRSDNQLAEVIEVWAPAMKAVKEESPSTYIVAEFTNLYDVTKATYGSHEAVKAQKNPNSTARFKDANEIGNIIIRETGMNSEANYADFFTAGLNTFGKDFVNPDGIDTENRNTTEDERVALLANALNKFADKSSDYKQNAYIFGGNHDKPRMADCFGMDMALAHTNLNNRSNEEEINHRKTAYMIMNDLMFEDDLKKVNPNYDNKTGWDIIKNDDKYFNNVSSLAIAKANWLRSSIGLANRIVTNERLKDVHDDAKREEIQKDSNKIYAAMSKSIKDIVNGEFYLNGENDNKNKDIADSYKKQLEKDGFGAKDILTAYGLITQHAEAKYDLKNTYLHNPKDKKHFDQLVEKIAIGIPSAKVRMFTQMINALPGNPTVYAGDDYAMSGYEEKNHNLWLGNRNIIPHDVVNPKNPNYKKYIDEHKTIMDGIVKTRKDDIDNKLAPLNNGTMFKLNDIYGVNASDRDDTKGLRCPAILGQSSDGSMAISIFNFNGIALDSPFDKGDVDINKLDEYLNPHPKNVEIKDLVLQTEKTGMAFDIQDGIEFKNIDSTDPSSYRIHRDAKGICHLQRVFKENGGERIEPIYVSKDTAPEGVLRLYYQPDDVQKSIQEKKALEKKYTPSFKGSNKRIYFNPRYDIGVSNPYSASKKVETGSNLSIISVSK